MKINWQLYSNKELVINEIGKKAIWDKAQVIYEDEYGKHIINREHKLYNHINNDNEVIVDFTNNLLIIKFDNENLKFDIKTKYQAEDDKISLWYAYGEEEKEIVITRNEEE